MKGKIIFSLLLSAASGMALALPLTPSEALERLEETPLSKARGAEAPMLLATHNDAAGEAAIYIFTRSGDRGFMLLSADDAVPALLGYSDTNSFAVGDLSADMEWWLKLYTTQIQDARELGPYRESGTRAGEWAAINPMLRTTWDQGSPYNNQCPRENNRRSVTGCVATAMAQVMNYWRYPSVGKGSLSYSPTTLTETLSIDFSATPFDWENMLDSYAGPSSSKQKSAVAYLMKACGYSVKMKYSSSESGAYSRDIPNAMKTYFSYDSGVSRREKASYTQNEWNELIYRELSTVGPVIYSGQSSEGGHCFVCDGYDGQGYFHINWGWSGLSDGYFLLNALTPGDIGIGGYYGGFNINQEVTVGLMPPVGRLTLVGDITVENRASDSGNTSGWGYTNRIDEFTNIVISMNIRVTGGSVHSPIYVTVYETDPSTLKQGQKVYDATSPDILNANEGMTAYSTVVSMTDYDPSKLYTLTVAYELKGERKVIGSLRMAASSGVDDVIGGPSELSIQNDGNAVTAEGPGQVLLQVFDLSGALVAQSLGERPSVDVKSLSRGVYMVRASGSAGASKTLKLLLK